ncbi:MAG: carboxypeptidase-like regulatory domain-containing protein, partial [Cyclobacteriaceae bacterium]
MKRFRFLVFLIVFCSLTAVAQKSSIKVQGIVVDNSTSKPLSYATIALYEAGTKELITGDITDADGKFSIRSSSSNFYVEVSFLGYNTITISDYEVNGQSVYLKTIKVQPNDEILDDVMVIAEKSQTVFELDKRVF